MLSVCFRMKVIIALLQLLQQMIAEAKGKPFQREKWQKLEKNIGPAIQVTLHLHPQQTRTPTHCGRRNSCMTVYSREGA